MMRAPLDAPTAWEQVRGWLACEVAWVPAATERHADVMEGLLTTHRVTGDLVADTDLAALALEHGLTVISADTDFARFTEIEWVNPLV